MNYKLNNNKKVEKISPMLTGLRAGKSVNFILAENSGFRWTQKVGKVDKITITDNYPLIFSSKHIYSFLSSSLHLQKSTACNGEKPKGKGKRTKPRPKSPTNGKIKKSPNSYDVVVVLTNAIVCSYEIHLMEYTSTCESAGAP